MPNLHCEPGGRRDCVGKEAFRKTRGECYGRPRAKRGSCPIQFTVFPLEPDALLSSTALLAFSIQACLCSLGPHPSSRRIIYFAQDVLNHSVSENTSQKEGGASVLHLALSQVEQHLKAEWRTLGRTSSPWRNEKEEEEQEKGGQSGRSITTVLCNYHYSELSDIQTIFF